MIVLLNSSKTLDFEPVPTGRTPPPTVPEFITDTEILVKELFLRGVNLNFSSFI